MQARQYRSFDLPGRVEANRSDGAPNMLGRFTYGQPVSF